ncbi:MAG TPA: phosphatidate cytidylyltransferase [Burkholderiales bacterium]|nr:phosphatidate cytidylyltransferase [Burkholderiales bacterium]
MLHVRVLTAILMLAAFVGALFFLPPLGWGLFLAVLLFGGVREWARLVRVYRVSRYVFASIATALGLWFAWLSGLLEGAVGDERLQYLYGAASLFWMIGAPLWLRVRPERFPLWALLPLGALILVATYCALVHLRNIGPGVMLMFMAVVWIADVAAYFSGRKFGGRKLAPNVSPGKTWAGAYGAFVATAIYAALWIYLLPELVPAALTEKPGGALWMFPLIALLTAASIIGDLFESILKRRAGLKDSGAMLPGHGGVLDRIDALLPVLPLAAWVSMQ